MPLHRSAVEVLADYARRRDEHHPHPRAGTFFLDDKRGPLGASAVGHTFVELRRTLGWATNEGRPPRLHDMRHTMVVRTLLCWYRQGFDVDRKLPALSTYLGHVEVRDTYWYLTAVPELMALVAERFQACQGRMS